MIGGRSYFTQSIYISLNLLHLGGLDVAEPFPPPPANSAIDEVKAQKEVDKAQKAKAKAGSKAGSEDDSAARTEGAGNDDHCGPSGSLLQKIGISPHRRNDVISNFRTQPDF